MQIKNTLIVLGRASAVLFLALAAWGCARAPVDLIVDLSYQSTVNASGGSGEVFIAKPKEYHGLTKKSSGWVIGRYGRGRGDVVTYSDIGDWIVGALIEELSAAGYRVRTVTALPQDVTKGLDLAILRVFVRDDLSWTGRAISNVQFTVEIWRNGAKVKQLNISAKGDDLSFTLEKQNPISLRKALQAAMLEAVPEIIKTLEN